MKAILLMFDSLNRHMLPPYGCDWVHAPNFARLAQRSATFDNSSTPDSKLYDNSSSGISATSISAAGDSMPLTISK